MSAHPRSKTRATWLTLLGGTFGLHRFWRHGLRDAWGWLHLLATLTGLAGLQRLDAFGIDDAQAAWMLPLGGLSPDGLRHSVRSGTVRSRGRFARP